MKSHFDYYDHLGHHGCFYSIQHGQIITYDSFSSAVKGIKPILNVPAVLECIMRRNVLGNRTIINNIYKSPWMARPNALDNEWEYFEVPRHKKTIYTSDELRELVIEKLKNEVKGYIGESRKIGILLTGGMDSRVIAGVLNQVLTENKSKDVSVTGITWGIDNSRDVVYAERIANKLGWNWLRLNLGAEDLKANIYAAAIRGCEYSPLHLHAMLKVRDLKGFDCILAGSFGDSIGRGEYAGKKFFQLNDIRAKLKNENGFIRESVISDYKPEINRDVEDYWEIFPSSFEHERLERDYQIHYMRRKLNPCLSVINESIPLYQCFSNPEVFGFFWSLDPVLRNNDIYTSILKTFVPDLLSIPWARTGFKYDEKKGEPDEFLKKSHSYSEWVRNELYEHIKKLVLSESIEGLGLFNMSAIENYLKLIKKKHYLSNLADEERLLWMASLSIALKSFRIESNFEVKSPSVFDGLNSFRPILRNSYLRMKETYRKTTLG